MSLKFLTLFSCVILSMSAYPNDGETSSMEPSSEPVRKVKMDGKTTLVTQETHTMTITDDGTPPPSWRCKPIPEEAFQSLKGGGKKGGVALIQSSWGERAAQFVIAVSPLCPHYAALQKELPPWVGEKHYTEILEHYFNLNRKADVKKLLKVARGNEVEALQNKSGKNDPKEMQSAKIKSAVAGILLAVKYPDEVKVRYEASAHVRKFMTEYVDKKGNFRQSNVSHLKTYFKKLDEKDKLAVKGYLNEMLSEKEFPKAGLLTSRKNDREPASLSKRELSLRAAMQVLFWELE